MKSFPPLLMFAQIDTKYDFDNDKFSSVKRRKYPYEFCKEKICDGLLVSKTMLDQVANVRIDDAGKFKIYKKGNSGICYSTIREFFYLQNSRSFVSFADPGTWSYVHKLELPDFLYDQDLVFRYYNDLRFDLCGSVDWPIVDKIRVKDSSGKVNFRELGLKEKLHRLNLTVELAELFMKKCSSKKNINFIPFGTIQGYNVATYIDSLKRVLKLGYKYVAIGGLPSYSEKKVLELLVPIKKCVRKYGDGNIGIHLYGRFPSPTATLAFARAGVTSFDNNYPYISATKNVCSTFNPDYKYDKDVLVPSTPCYSIKIPSVRGKSVLAFKRRSSEEDLDSVMSVGNKCYRKFVSFDKNQSSINRRKFIRSYKKMYRFFRTYGVVKISDSKIDNIIRVAIKSLRDKIWEKCGCTMCRMAGSHIVLIRGTRFRYTFVHNTYVQYLRLLKELKRKKVRKYDKRYDWSSVYEKRNKNHSMSFNKEKP